MTAPLRPPRVPFSSFWTQMFPPSPAFTETDIPDLHGKVFVVTGSNTGVGREVARILYSKNATIFMAARSEVKTVAAIDDIRKQWPDSQGRLVFQQLDLADLSSIKTSANIIKSQAPKIHVLFNNAAVQLLDPDGSNKTAQGHEIHLGVNILGTFLFTKFLTPRLVETARSEPAGSVRVVWVSSLGTEAVGEKSRGITADYVNYWPALRPLERYGISKAGNWLSAVEFARRYKAQGIVSVPCNPGHLRSDLYRSGSWLFQTVVGTICYPSVYGAYTELFSGLSDSITIEETGKWVAPWGRLHPIRKDLLDATKSTAEGGNGHAEAYWKWMEEQVKDFL